MACENWPGDARAFSACQTIHGKFRFGWSEIGAASAEARVWYSGDKIMVEVKGEQTVWRARFGNLMPGTRPRF